MHLRNKNDSYTEASLKLYGLFTVILIIYYISSTIFAGPTKTDFIRAGFFLLYCLLIFVAILMLFYFVAHKNMGWGRFEQTKNIFFIGSVGIFFCGNIYSLCIFFELDSDGIWYSVYISLMSMFSFYFIFHYPIRNEFKVDHETEKSDIWIGGIIVYYTISIICTMSIYGKGPIFYCQLGFILISVWSTCDMCQILGGRVKWNNGDNQARNTGNPQNNRNAGFVKITMESGIVVLQRASTPEETPWNPADYLFSRKTLATEIIRRKLFPRAAPPKPTNIQKVILKVECKICLLEYSERRIPRNLKECGHTVCEECADELLKSHGQRYLQCPFCRKTTVVKGPAKLLPKNYEIMEVIERMNKKDL